MGLGAVSRSPLADANRKRPQEIFGELFGCLYQRCRRQAPGQRFAFRHRVYSLDAAVIDLCLKVFDWAKFRKRKGAIKLHLILDHAGHIPSFCVMTPGREHEIEVARGQRYEPDSILTFDRAYVDYHWFDQLHRQGVSFVTRQKRNARYRVLERRPVGPQPGVTSDQDQITSDSPDREGGRVPVDSPAPDWLPGPGDGAVLCLLDQPVSSHGGGGGRHL